MVVLDVIAIDDSWKDALAYEFSQPYFSDIKKQLLQESAS